MGYDAQLLPLISEIYEAAADASAFPALAKAIARHFNTESTFLYLCGDTAGHDVDLILAATPNFDKWARSSYNEYYHQRDEWFGHTTRHKLPQVVIGQELVDERTFLRSEWYADYCQKLDAFHLLGTMFPVDEALGVIGIHRPQRSKEFDRGDKRRLSLLLPHLQRAFQIHRRLSSAEAERSFASDVVERLGIGLLMVGERNRILFANAAAERVLRCGKALTASHGRLRPRLQRASARFDRMIGEAVLTSAGKGTSAGGVLSLPAGSGPPLSLLVSPLRAAAAQFGPATPAALVIFADPAAGKTVAPEVLASAYELTSAEARLLAALLAGQSLADYARSAGISINTANTHLDHVFAKTGHHRQADLVRTIAANPILRLS
jgi:DNA-binding CsgD family transcriptional regulator